MSQGHALDSISPLVVLGKRLWPGERVSGSEISASAPGSSRADLDTRGFFMVLQPASFPQAPLAEPLAGSHLQVHGQIPLLKRGMD